MSIKKTIDISIFDRITRKLLNNLYYNKSFIRSSLLNSKNLSIIDNYSNFFITQTEKIKYLHFPDKTFTYGNSINSKLMVFCNVFNNLLKFKLQSFIFSGFNPHFIDLFQSTLNKIYETENKYKSILILNPVKGGFSCYALGVFGFLPESHALIFFKKILQKVRALKRKSITSNFLLLDIFRKRSSFKKTHLFRFPLHIAKISVYQKKKKIIS